MDVFVLLSIPGFILAGNLMNRGGITQRIIRFANALVSWIRGGLGLTNIAASMLFGGITGAAVADAVLVHPAAMRAARVAKAGPGRIFLVTDAMAVAGTGRGAFTLGGRRIERCAGVIGLAEGDRVASTPAAPAASASGAARGCRCAASRCA